jgi:hypothetical protein
MSMRRVVLTAGSGGVACVLLAACSGESSATNARSTALHACNAYALAGIGVPSLPTSERKVEIRKAMTLAGRAAHADRRWTALQNDLTRLDTALRGSSYDGRVLPAGRANFQRLAADCASAGQKP